MRIAIVRAMDSALVMLWFRFLRHSFRSLIAQNTSFNVALVHSDSKNVPSHDGPAFCLGRKYIHTMQSGKTVIMSYFGLAEHF